MKLLADDVDTFCIGLIVEDITALESNLLFLNLECKHKLTKKEQLLLEKERSKHAL